MWRRLAIVLLLATAATGCLGGQSGSGARAHHEPDGGPALSCVCESAAAGTALHATVLERTGSHLRARVEAIVDPRGAPAPLAAGDEVAGTWVLAERCGSIPVAAGDEVLLFATPGAGGWLDSDLAVARWGATTFTFGTDEGDQVVVPAADLAMLQDTRTCRSLWP